MSDKVYFNERRERNLALIRDMRKVKMSLVELVIEYKITPARMRSIERSYVKRGIVPPRSKK